MKARTLISFCQSAPRNPSHGEPVAVSFVGVDGLELMSTSKSAATHARRPEMPSSAPVCRAIISSSLVGTTHAETRLLDVEILGPCAALALESSATPTQDEASQIRRRISAEC